MSATQLVILLVVTGLATACIVPAVRLQALRSGSIDEPGARRLHTQRVPRGGGLAIAVVLLAAVLLAPATLVERLGMVAALAACGWIGWLDDCRPRPPWQRLAVQSLAAIAVLVAAGGLTTVELAGRSVCAPLLWNALALVAVVWCLNLYNFMDGSNGLATMQAGVSAVAMAWLGRGDPATQWLALALAGAALGFLPWNFPRARIFLGDAGSLTLGLAVAAISLRALQAGVLTLPVVLILSSVFAVDATATLLHRAGSGAKWWQPHREHAYQRLVTGGWSHAGVWWLYLAVNVLLVWPAAWLASRYTDGDWIILLGLIALLLAGWSYCLSLPSGHGDEGTGS